MGSDDVGHWHLSLLNWLSFLCACPPPLSHQPPRARAGLYASSSLTSSILAPSVAPPATALDFPVDLDSFFDEEEETLSFLAFFDFFGGTSHAQRGMNEST